MKEPDGIFLPALFLFLVCGLIKTFCNSIDKRQISKKKRTKNKQTKKIQQQKNPKTVPQQYLAEVPFKIISLIFAFQKFDVHYEIRQSRLKWSRCAQGDYTEGEIGHILI